ncbi:MAG: glycosyltransferase family 4 protein [Verrucomicrobiae bacterium]|nr:glycosyltransferase family 4 protein [Verrucomicrobiae bacterium]
MTRWAIIGDFSHPNYLGGAARHVYDLAREFRRRGIECCLATRRPDGFYGLGIKDKFWEQLKAEGRLAEFGKTEMMLPWRYWKTVRGADVVNVHHPIMGFWGGLLAKAMGKALIYNFHGPLCEEYRAKGGRNFLVIWMYRWLQNLLLRLADAIWVHSDYMRGLCCRLCQSCGGKIRQLPGYVDVRRYHPTRKDARRSIRQRLGWREDGSFILTCRRLTPRTGVLELARMWPETVQRLAKPATLVICGRGELEPEIRRAAGEGVKVMGYVEEELLPDVYRACDMCLLPSRELEGFGLVVLEGFACGLPVLVSSLSGGAAEFVRTINPAWIYDTDDPRDLARAINGVLAAQNDGLTERGLVDVATAHDLSRLADAYLELADVLPKK